MKKEQLLDELLCELYDEHLKGDEYSNDLFKDFEEKYGSHVLHELMNELQYKGWTNIKSKMGCQGDICIQIGHPFLTLDAIDYIESKRKSWWKKINYKYIFFTVICGGIGYFVFSILPNLDKIIENFEKYILPMFK